MTDDQLLTLLLHRFATAGELSAWLQLNMWPRMKAAAAARHSEAVAQRRKARSPISTRYTDLDGSPITEKEVWRRLQAKEQVRDAATGQLLYGHGGMVGRRVWNLWQPYPQNNS